MDHLGNLENDGKNGDEQRHDARVAQRQLRDL
jgi:hypothetical protein